MDAYCDLSLHAGWEVGSNVESMTLFAALVMEPLPVERSGNWGDARMQLFNRRERGPLIPSHRAVRRVPATRISQLFCNCACRPHGTASEIFRSHGYCVSNKYSNRSGLQPSVLVLDVTWGCAPGWYRAGPLALKNILPEQSRCLWPSKTSCLSNLDAFGPVNILPEQSR